MRRLTPSQISDEFNAQRDVFAATHVKSGANAAIEALSQAISDMQQAGFDVALTIFGMPSEQAFDLFSSNGSLIVPFSGILRIGPLQQLVAIATKVNGEPALQLGVSEFDIRFSGVEGAIKDNKITGVMRHIVYDLKNDPEALAKFQKETLRHCARNDVVDSHDAAGVFDNGAALRKPRLAPKAP